MRDKSAVSVLFREISAKVGDRPGGYNRVIKLGNRMGDNASMALIELVDFNELYNIEVKSKKKTRRRGSGKKTTRDIETSKEKLENEKSSDKKDDKTSDTDSNLTDS